MKKTMTIMNLVVGVATMMTTKAIADVAMKSMAGDMAMDTIMARMTMTSEKRNWRHNPL